MRAATRHYLRAALGLWIAQTEGAKFWLQMVTELKNRGYSVIEQDTVLAKALGGTTIYANLIIGFAKLANSGSYRSAEVEHGVKLSLSTQSKFMVRGDDGSMKQFEFRQEVVLPSQIGAKVADVGRTGGQTALLIFNALGARPSTQTRASGGLPGLLRLIGNRKR